MLKKLITFDLNIYNPLQSISDAFCYSSLILKLYFAEGR